MKGITKSISSVPQSKPNLNMKIHVKVISMSNKLREIAQDIFKCVSFEQELSRDTPGFSELYLQ